MEIFFHIKILPPNPSSIRFPHPPLLLPRPPPPHNLNSPAPPPRHHIEITPADKVEEALRALFG